MPAPLRDEEYRRFHDWVARRYGLAYGPEKRDILRARLEPSRIELGFDTFDQLLFHLKFHPDRERQQRRVVSALTNNESFFFRERAQLELLRTEVLPEWKSRLGAGGTLRLLSVGCAAGEEPYTLAIVLIEAGLFPDERIRIIGLDVDADALERARAARYRDHALRGLEPARRDRYFRREGDHWRLDDRVRRMVGFEHANLLGDDWVGRLPPQHVCFCRNVLIYFDEDATARAAERLHAALAPGGALFLGHAETLSRVPTPLRAERRPGAIFYREERRP